MTHKLIGILGQSWAPRRYVAALVVFRQSPKNVPRIQILLVIQFIIILIFTQPGNSVHVYRFETRFILPRQGTD